MSKYNIDSGFLILYDWLPAIKSLPGEDAKALLLALIELQRDGIPLPDFGDSMAGVFAQIIEPTIMRRLNGKKLRAQRGTDTPPHSDPHGDPLGDPPSRAEQSEAEQSKAELLPPPEVEEEEFTEFWKEYPKHTAKAEARSAFFEAVRSRKDFEELLALLDRWKRSSEWKTDKGKWIKRADKFLTEVFPTRDGPPDDEGSFDTDEFFEAALRRSCEITGGDAPAGTDLGYRSP